MRSASASWVRLTMKAFRRLLLIEWSGLVAAIFIGSGALALIAPNFLTESIFT
jgi:hypothetical protein